MRSIFNMINFVGVVLVSCTGGSRAAPTIIGPTSNIWADELLDRRTIGPTSYWTDEMHFSYLYMDTRTAICFGNPIAQDWVLNQGLNNWFKPGIWFNLLSDLKIALSCRLRRGSADLHPPIPSEPFDKVFPGRLLSRSIARPG